MSKEDPTPTKAKPRPHTPPCSVCKIMAQATEHGSEVSAKVVSSACPPGMEPLLYTSEIIIRQRKGWSEALFGSDNTDYCYEVLDKDDHRLFIGKEERSTCNTICCIDGNRAFTIYILNNFGRRCLIIERHCFWNSVKIYGSDGNFGRVDHNCGPNFTIYDSNDKAALTLRGPCCRPCCLCCCDYYEEIQFSVMDMKGKEIGMIHKRYGKYLKESSAKGYTYSVKFPEQLDFRLKMLLVGALFLIDFMYFHGSMSWSILN